MQNIIASNSLSARPTFQPAQPLPTSSAAQGPSAGQSTALKQKPEGATKRSTQRPNCASRPLVFLPTPAITGISEKSSDNVRSRALSEQVRNSAASIPVVVGAALADGVLLTKLHGYACAAALQAFGTSAHVEVAMAMGALTLQALALSTRSEKFPLPVPFSKLATFLANATEKEAI